MTKILLCGYSYHTQRFYSPYKSGIPMYLLRLQSEGNCKVVVKGKQLVLRRGDLLLLKPGDTYELLIEEGDNSGDYHIICEGDWINEWWNNSEKPTISHIDMDNKLLALWRQLIVEKRRVTSEVSGELSNYLSWTEKRRSSSEISGELFDYLLRALCLYLERSIIEISPSLGLPHKVVRMLRYIEEHATTTFKVEEVAQQAGLSVSRAVHLFKQFYGQTMMEYAQEIRLSTATEMMKYTSLTLDQIAEASGFGSYPYFHRVFKKKYGVSPGAFRKSE